MAVLHHEDRAGGTRGAVLVRKCRTGKVAFRDELAAKIALARRVWKDKGERRTYKCKFCNHYHLTSQESRQAA